MHAILSPDQLHLSVDGLILTVHHKPLAVLLAQRPNPPCQGQWALPGRLVNTDESAADAMASLLAEMLPGAKAYCEQLYTFTDPQRDARSRVVTIAHLVLIPWSRLEPALAQPGVALRCFDIRHEADGVHLYGANDVHLTPGQLAFDHGEILLTGLNRMQGKIDYTDIAFHLVQDMAAFSLSELQAVFEAVLNQPLDASNFRRGILARYEANGRLQQTTQAKKQGRGRPAALYQFQPQR